jgi:hypothetical protein
MRFVNVFSVSIAAVVLLLTPLQGTSASEVSGFVEWALEQGAGLDHTWSRITAGATPGGGREKHSFDGWKKHGPRSMDQIFRGGLERCQWNERTVESCNGRRNLDSYEIPLHPQGRSSEISAELSEPLLPVPRYAEDTESRKNAVRHLVRLPADSECANCEEALFP